MKRMSETLFLLALLATFPALLWEYGARQTTVFYLYERWSGYASFAWKGIIISVVVATICALLDRRLTAFRRKHQAQRARLKNRQRQERNMDNLRIRWSAETGIPQYKR